MIFSFFGSYTYVYQFVYHFNSKQIGLTFIAIIVGKQNPEPSVAVQMKKSITDF